jgi:hypothetical protein
MVAHHGRAHGGDLFISWLVVKREKEKGAPTAPPRTACPRGRPPTRPLFCFFFFFAVLGLELRAYTLSHSTGSFL